MSENGNGVRLTSREFEVAALLVEGRSYQEIGRDLSISPHTVEMHVRIMAGKMPGSGAPHVRIIRWFSKAVH